MHRRGRYSAERNYFRFFPRLAFFPHLPETSGVETKPLPFWAAKLASAFGWAQKPWLISIRPFLPPNRVRLNFVTGTSGTNSKLLRRAPLTESVLPASSTSIGWVAGPWRAATRSGSLWAGLDRR